MKRFLVIFWYGWPGFYFVWIPVHLVPLYYFLMEICRVSHTGTGWIMPALSVFQFMLFLIRLFTVTPDISLEKLRSLGAQKWLFYSWGKQQ